MKKSILSVAILSALVAGAASAATVYKNDTTNLNIGGRAEARLDISDVNKTSDRNGNNVIVAMHGDSSNQDVSRARIHFIGDTKINDDLAAFGKYEAEIATGTGLNKDTKYNISTRYLFAGLKTKVGDISYGKQDSAQVMLTNYTDILDTFGGDASDLIHGNADKRANNFLYSTTFDALTVKANYIVSDYKDDSSYGVATQYSFPFGLNIGVGYVGGKQRQAISTTAYDNVDQFNIAASYDINNFYVSGLFVVGSSDLANGSTKSDLEGYEFAAAYTWNKMTFRSVYDYKETKPSGGSTTKSVDYVALEGVYKYNSNMRLYAGYKFNQLSGGDDELLMGARYDF